MTRPAHTGLYTLPLGVPFLPALARGLTARFGDELHKALILLPTRRAVRDFTQYLAKDQSVMRLPRMRPLADIDPSEPPFEPDFLLGKVQPAISNMRRRTELARIVAHYMQATGSEPIEPAAAMGLVDPILHILDDAALEEVTLSELEGLDDIKSHVAEHFQNAADLYQILQTYWPDFLRENALMDPMQRRVRLLNALTDYWTDTPPRHPVIIAGSTGTLGATARLMRCVLSQPDGFVVLPGLDTHMTSSAWQNVGPEHSQYSLKRLMTLFETEFQDVQRWPFADQYSTANATARRRLISESLVPTDDTADWPVRIETLRGTSQDSDIFKDALEGLSLLEADTDEEEALSIALLLRHVLETEGKTAALVTPDTQLARRVTSELTRWDITIDISQGRPLEETSVGQLMGYTLDLAISMSQPQHLATYFRHHQAQLCKHPRVNIGLPPGDLCNIWQSHEKALRMSVFGPPKEPDPPQALLDMRACLEPLAQADPMPASAWSIALVTCVEALCVTPERSGAETVWIGDDGEAAASLFEQLIQDSDALGPMSLETYARLLSQLMRAQTVRPRFGTHPRLQILGPLESRMINVDTVILGGLNEGTWPGTPALSPFLSRAMRQHLGLSLPDRRYGLSAHDFATLASLPHVIMTRSKKSNSGPNVASRWIWRLKTLIRGALPGNERTFLGTAQAYLDWAQNWDHVPHADLIHISPPTPMPKPEQRWPRGRKLSVTQFKVWVRDPYAIYARHILGLDVLDPLTPQTQANQYGSMVHDALETFTKAYPDALPPDADAKLCAYMIESFGTYGFPAHLLSSERIRLEAMAAQCIDWLQTRKDAGWTQIAVEDRGRLYIPDIDFTISARADRIERGPSGYALIDYKTGRIPTTKEVKATFDTQLPLSSYMLEEGGFSNLTPQTVSEWGYLRVSAQDRAQRYTDLLTGKNALDKDTSQADTIAWLKHWIKMFDKAETPYLSQPRIQFTNGYGVYDHLARRAEWDAGLEGGDDA